MTSRTQYMIFLIIWAAALVAAFIVALSSDFDVGRNVRGLLVLFGFLALVPAAAGYVLVLRVGSLIDRWRVKRGHDIYQERKYEDDAGFIHLDEVPAFEEQEEIGLNEIVSEVEPLIDHTFEGSDDS